MLRKKKGKESIYRISPADVDLPDDSDLVHVEEDPVPDHYSCWVPSVTMLLT